MLSAQGGGVGRCCPLALTLQRPLRAHSPHQAARLSRRCRSWGVLVAGGAPQGLCFPASSTAAHGISFLEGSEVFMCSGAKSDNLQAFGTFTCSSGNVGEHHRAHLCPALTGLLPCHPRVPPDVLRLQYLGSPGTPLPLIPVLLCGLDSGVCFTLEGVRVEACGDPPLGPGDCDICPTCAHGLFILARVCARVCVSKSGHAQPRARRGPVSTWAASSALLPSVLPPCPLPCLDVIQI